MAVTRRGFLQRTAGAAALAAAGRPTWQAELEASTPHRSTVRVLGEEPTRPMPKLIRTLSADVFDRLCQTFKGRSCQLLEHSRIGMGDLHTQANTAISLGYEFAGDHPPVFDIAVFRQATNAWMLGQMVHINWDTSRSWAGVKVPASWLPQDNRETTFAGMTVMGMPYLPGDVEWTAHYIDERTGVRMRAVASYDCATDQVVARWDVICGYERRRF